MNLHLLHTLTGFGIILSLLCKVVIHLYIDYSKEKYLNLNSILVMPLVYLLPYNSGLQGKYTKLKFVCNSFFVLACISLLLNIVFGILIFNK
jgi:hypothetical protein